MENTKTRAKRIRTLIAKEKRLLGSRQKLTDFKEPVLMLIKRNRDVQFFEEASKGVFTFQHSDKKDREIILDPAYMIMLDYAGRKVRGYICHEDSPVPLTGNAVLDSQQVSDLVIKSLYDMRKLDEAKAKIQQGWLKMIVWAAAIAVGLALAWKVGPGVIDKLFGTHLAQATTQVINNASAINR